MIFGRMMFVRDNKANKHNKRINDIKEKRDSVSRKLAFGSDAVSVEQLVELEIALAMARSKAD